MFMWSGRFGGRFGFGPWSGFQILGEVPDMMDDGPLLQMGNR